jgi:hypothetical protein
LSKKITMLYEALSWEEPNDNFGFNKFFWFWRFRMIYMYIKE